MQSLLAVIILLTISVSIVIYYSKQSKTVKINSSDAVEINHTTNGIVYFDVDGTLTSVIDNHNKLVEECIDMGYLYGIITASNRTLWDVCVSPNKSAVRWMPDGLCKDSTLYNSRSLVAGSSNFPIGYPYGESQGYIKGWLMDYGRNLKDSTIPDRNVVLFDDDPDFISGVKRFNPNFTVQCVGSRCGGPVLDSVLVKTVLDKIRK
jgi:hypothetical protein